MKKLKHLSIRNMPQMASTLGPTPEFLLKSLANIFVDIVNLHKPSGCGPLLRTLAIGAPLYRDVRVGTNHFSNNLVYDPSVEFLQFRIYQVDYNYESLQPLATAVSLIAKGTPDDAWRLGRSEIPDWGYWLV